MNKPLLISCYCTASFETRGHTSTEKPIQITDLQIDKIIFLISKRTGI